MISGKHTSLKDDPCYLCKGLQISNHQNPYKSIRTARLTLGLGSCLETSFLELERSEAAQPLTCPSPTLSPLLPSLDHNIEDPAKRAWEGQAVKLHQVLEPQNQSIRERATEVGSWIYEERSRRRGSGGPGMMPRSGRPT
jgi:hypothetical protein